MKKILICSVVSLCLSTLAGIGAKAQVVVVRPVHRVVVVARPVPPPPPVRVVVVRPVPPPPPARVVVVRPRPVVRVYARL